MLNFYWIKKLHKIKIRIEIYLLYIIILIIYN